MHTCSPVRKRKWGKALLVFLHFFCCWCFYFHAISLHVCLHLNEQEPRGGGWGYIVWVGVKDRDITTACGLVLLHCPDTDRSSIVPVKRGLPRFPCVRNHPPTCSGRQGPRTMKLYTESLWAGGRALMKDSVTVERITNARLPDTVHAEHTHTYLQRHNADTQTHSESRQVQVQFVTTEVLTAQT